MIGYKYGQIVLVAADGARTVPQPLYQRAEWEATAQASYETDGENLLFDGRRIDGIGALKRVRLPRWARD